MMSLSGYAEYMYLLCKGIKDVENRNWPLSRYFKPEQLPVKVYIHASKTKATKEDTDFIFTRLSPYQYADFSAVDWDKIRGNIIGEIIITHELMAWCFSKWAIPGQHHFMVRSGKLYTEMIPCKGQLGFFEPGIKI